VAGEAPIANTGAVLTMPRWGRSGAVVELLEKGVFPPRDPAQAPGQYMVQPAWHKLLKIPCKAGNRIIGWPGFIWA